LQYIYTFYLGWTAFFEIYLPQVYFTPEHFLQMYVNQAKIAEVGEWIMKLQAPWRPMGQTSDTGEHSPGIPAA
jgi:hypothetical protein